MKVIELKNGDYVRLNGKGSVMKVGGIGTSSLRGVPWYLKPFGAFGMWIVIFLCDDFIMTRSLELTDLVRR